MNTKKFQLTDRRYGSKGNVFIWLQLLKSIAGDLVNPRHSYAFLKGILGLVLRQIKNSKVSLETLRRLGLFVTPSASDGDELDEPKEYKEVEDERQWYPFKPVPNVSQFEVELKAYDPIFAMFGIRKRFSPNIKFEKYKNNKYNRYMERQLRRLKVACQGKIVEENDFTQLIEIHDKKVLYSFSSLDQCVETLNKSLSSVVIKIATGSKFKFKKKGVRIKKDEERYLKSTYESVESINGLLVKERRLFPDPALYFRIVTSLLKYSKVFFLRQVMMTKPRWHREVPYYIIIRGWKTYRKIAKLASKYYDMENGKENHMSYDYKAIPRQDYFRVYIPKPNGKGRPLGVPSIPWRVYLGLGNKFLLKWCEGKMNPHQHAYQPGKSVITLGRDIMENIVNKRNIYSGDLEKYFDKVALDHATKALNVVLKVPEPICDYLSELHKSLPRNIKLGKFLFEGLKVKPSEQPLPEFIFAGIPRADFDLDSQIKKAMKNGKGIPQGGALSPLLSIVLQESKYFAQLEAQGASYVQFSDDLIVASDDDNWVPNVSVPEQGINESKEKSFGVKKNGKWLLPLEFCGLSYDGNLDRIIANTRSGSRLELKDVDGLISLYTFRELLPEAHASPDSGLPVNPSPKILGTEIEEKIKRNGFKKINSDKTLFEYALRHESTIKDILQHQLWGLLQARLYSGSGELEDYKQDFRLTAVKGSLVSKHYKHLLLEGVNVFTSTSGAFNVVINDLHESRRKSQRRGRLKILKRK